jgi:hypothetical protein
MHPVPNPAHPQAAKPLNPLASPDDPFGLLHILRTVSASKATLPLKKTMTT